jgi:molybdopterin synthase sulfur carrier subunit
MITVLYFARLRESLGTDREQLAPPPGVATVGQLADWLRDRGGNWTTELAADKPVRVAVNQEMAGPDTLLPDGAEVAFFPPVTGG